MSSEEQLIVSAADGTAQRLVVMDEQAPDARPIVLVLHGIASHSGWYMGLAKAIRDGGVGVYLLDRRGAGHSGGQRGHVRSWRVLVDDVLQVGRIIGERHPGRPLHALGISLGGAITLAASIMHRELFASQILLSPGLATTLRIPLRRRLGVMARAHLQPGRLYDVPFSIEQLTGVQAWREMLVSDPVRTREVSARFLLEVLRLQRFVRIRREEIHVPIKCFLAGDDAIIDNAAVIRILSGSGAPAVSVESFSGASHILAASIPLDIIAGHIVQWLTAPAVGGGAGGERFELIERLDVGGHGTVDHVAPQAKGIEPSGHTLRSNT